MKQVSEFRVYASALYDRQGTGPKSGDEPDPTPRPAAVLRGAAKARREAQAIVCELGGVAVVLGPGQFRLDVVPEVGVLWHGRQYPSRIRVKRGMQVS